MGKAPKIGTCVMFSRMDDMAEKFNVLRKNGFDTCQILCWQPDLWTEENGYALRILVRLDGSLCLGFL